MRITKLILLYLVISFIVSCSCKKRQKEMQPLDYLIQNLTLVSTSEAQENQNRGVSWILQMCSEHTDCSTIKRAYQGANVLNAGWMYLTSNPNRCKCAPDFYKDPRPKRVRIDICNSTCFPERGRVCQPQECFAGMKTAEATAAILNNNKAVYQRIDKSIAMAKNDFTKAAGFTELAVKACLECTLSTAARDKLNNYVKQKFSDIPGTKFVDNPFGSSCLPGYICERHGAPAGGPNLISDNDGLDYDAIDQWKYWRKNKTAYMVLGWKQCNNGLEKGESFKPPQDRKNYCGSSRDGADFSSFTGPGVIKAEGKPKKKDKKGCKTFHEAEDGKSEFVLKLGDGRTYGVFLAPSRLSKTTFKRVELRQGGKVIDESKPGTPGYRYGLPYHEDPANKRRRIYDLRKHPTNYGDNAVLFADGHCWALKKPRFRVD